MKSEDKQIVFQDLCARLPYHVRCKVWLKYGTTEEGPLDLEHNYGDVLQDAFFYTDRIKDIKPYLRPLSSMTDEEKGELKEYLGAEEVDCNGFGYPEGGTLEDYISTIPYSICVDVVNWLNKKMFDYRGLIPKGLALSTDEFNPYIEN